MLDPVGLDQGQALEQLVEGAEAAGEDDEGARVADEHQLAGEEVVEVERCGWRRGWAAAPCGSSMLSPTERPPASAAPRLAASIRPGPPPVITVKPCLARQAAGLAAELVPAVALLDPGRAEDRDAVVDVAQGVEAALDLVVDALEADVVLRLDVGGNAEQVLVVLRLRRSRSNPAKCPRRDSNPRRAA